MFRMMISHIGSHGSVVRALLLTSERLPVLIQVVRFCPSDISAPTLLNLRKPNQLLPVAVVACLREDNSFCCWDQYLGESGTLVLLTGQAFFCQSPVASTWPWAGLSRDHFIQHLLILESATSLNKVLLTSNCWKYFQLLFRYQKYCLMFMLSYIFMYMVHTHS
jgi:hypothetical protein